MNSRGEQLEKHEIVKARLIKKLNSKDQDKFNRLWEYCSEMNVYVQQKYSRGGDAEKIFGKSLNKFNAADFDTLPEVDGLADRNKETINALISKGSEQKDMVKDDDNKIDTFQPIIDFSNFLLIVLKLTRMEAKKFNPQNFNLDDKELLHEFVDDIISENFVKKFGFNLLKAKYLLDNYIVHHSNDDDAKGNPWRLQRWYKDDAYKQYPINLSSDNEDYQFRIVHILSMLEVSYTARQRKNYLFYCLLYLFGNDWSVKHYYRFLRDLSDKYFKDVYLVAEKLNNINTPIPDSFDSVMLENNTLNSKSEKRNLKSSDFTIIYGDGNEVSKGIPLFIFNYLDYKLWAKYADELRGENLKEESVDRKSFFTKFGCSDFGLDVFKNFYFSRTRRSLEHYFPQANATGENDMPNEEQINCLGNYAMIGTEANSSGSNWTPKAKLDHYLDKSDKIKQVSVASIKFMIMMQMCKDNINIREDGKEWTFDDIKKHQEKMIDILLR
jgi:hypothetical protein